MSILNSNLKKLSALSCIGITAVILTACGGGGSNGGNVIPITPIIPVNPINPVTCITKPDPNSLLPTKNSVASADQVFHNYTGPDSNWQIYGYTNPNPIHVKTINIYNNYNHVIYPVVYSPTPFTGSDGQQKTLSRIFVGRPSCENPSMFYAGIPPNGAAIVYVPKQMWASGHVKIFTEVPDFLQEDTHVVPIVAPQFTTDKAPNSPNFGYFLYASGTANDFPQELPFQLTEYTIESVCKTDTPNCATLANDKLTVDFDISAVDQLFLPVAMQESSGSRGYVGTGMTVDNFQSQLQAFVRGDSGFSYSPQVGWPFYYGSNGANGYLNNLIKIPMGYNVFNSILFPSFSPFDPNITKPTINSIFVYNKNVSPPTPTGNQAVLQQVLTNTSKTGLQDRWMQFWQANPTVCNGQAQPFCNNFLQTMNFLHINITNACKYSLTHPLPPTAPADPAICDSTTDPRSVLRDIDKIKALVGYTPLALTFDDPGGPYPAVDPQNICGTPPLTGVGQFYSNCLRDSAKSVQRGVPHPFSLYPTLFYPDLSSIYTLNPVVWLVHKQLGLSEYAFSVDDDIGNQELVGKSFTITVGALDGLVSSNAYGGVTVDQILAFPNGTNNPFWTGSVTGVNASGVASSFPACIPGQVGACDLNIQAGGFSSVSVALQGIANPSQTFNFTIGAGPVTSCTRANPAYNYTPLVITSCTASAGLRNCSDPGLLAITFSSPTTCAQTVNPARPTT